MIKEKSSDLKVSFYGGKWMALVPFFVFIVGVIVIALSGAPDEKGFWPILVFALGVGLLLSKNKKAYSESVLKGMSNPMVM
ncbi:MAG: sodium:proton antiporter, partial [Saprospiraceae bacterium]|nr:sodium:proton antiporter [Saprospiraceae bacterium]